MKDEDKVEILEAEVVEEISNPDFSDAESYDGRKKGERGTRKGDYPSFTPEVREEILQAVNKGSPPKHAAQIAGISPATLYRWLERGRVAQNRIEDGYEDELTPVEEDFANFFVQYGRTASTIVKELLEGILAQAKLKPYLAMKLLEKIDPAEFGPKQTVDMNVAGKVGVGHIHVDARQLESGGDVAKQLSTEELRLLRSNLMKEKKALAAGDIVDDEE